MWPRIPNYTGRKNLGYDEPEIEYRIIQKDPLKAKAILTVNFSLRVKNSSSPITPLYQDHITLEIKVEQKENYMQLTREKDKEQEERIIRLGLEKGYQEFEIKILYRRMRESTIYNLNPLRIRKEITDLIKPKKRKIIPFPKNSLT